MSQTITFDLLEVMGLDDVIEAQIDCEADVYFSELVIERDIDTCYGGEIVKIDLYVDGVLTDVENIKPVESFIYDYFND